MSAPAAARLNGLGREAAAAALESCCGSRRWVEGMLARRPFAGEEALDRAAAEVWWALGEEDWREAFSHHPRIGDGAAAGAGEAGKASRAWSRREQARAAVAPEAVRAELEAGNRAYERRFGHVFLIRAAGRTGEEILAELRRRLGNEAAEELREAAVQQLEITRLRLRKLAAGEEEG